MKVEKIPPTWMIEELERRRREREEEERPRAWLEIPAPEPLPRERPERPAAREPIVIDLWD
jgi:hypothetical protein